MTVTALTCNMRLQICFKLKQINIKIFANGKNKNKTDI